MSLSPRCQVTGAAKSLALLGKRVTVETGARGGKVPAKAEIDCRSLGGHFETGQEGRAATVDRFQLSDWYRGRGRRGRCLGPPQEGMRGEGGGEKGREEGEARRGEAREGEGSGRTEQRREGAVKERGNGLGEAKRRSEEMSRGGATGGGTWSR